MFPVSFSNQASTLGRIVVALLIILILGRFIVVGMAKVLFNSHSSDGDESAYLELGLALREEGTLTDGTRPPLYPLLLAAVASRDWSYFTWAKLLTLGLGTLTVLSTFLIGRQMFNWETGLLAAFLLAANREFHLRAATVYADTLLVLLFLAAWYFLIKSLEKQSYYRYLAGFVVGLAYLTKSSATLLLVAWGLTTLFHYRGRIWAQKQLLVTPAVFLLTVSPLLIYNWAEFGNPFYSFATTHVMWMDRWAESQVAEESDLPTISTYFQTHTLADAAARLRFGVSRLNPELVRTLIPSREVEPAWLAYAGLICILMVGGWLLLFRRQWIVEQYQRHRLKIQMFLFLAIPFYFFSAWYARVLMESRFLIPILGPFYVLITAAVAGLVRNLGRWITSRQTTAAKAVYQWAYLAIVAAGLIWGVWWLILTSSIDAWGLSVNPFVSDREANAAPETVLDWLVRAQPPEMGPAQVIFGPSKSLPLWKFPRHFTFERIPIDVNTWERLQEYVNEVAPEYIIIDSDTARRRRQALDDYFSYSDKGVEFRDVPPGWMLTDLYGHAPHSWSIFTPFTMPSVPVLVNLGEQIELMGYDLSQRIEGDKRRLDVTLYWRAIAPAKDDYTIFLHLTAPDGFVKAQQDQQPFDGLWPTGRWTANDLFADHYTILLDDWLEPGEYLLLAGLYDPQSGQRLSLISAPPAPSPDAILLGKIQVK